MTTCGVKPAVRVNYANDVFWPTAAEDNNTDAKISGLTERQVTARNRTFLGFAAEEDFGDCFASLAMTG
jgi:hypothetical protein